MRKLAGIVASGAQYMVRGYEIRGIAVPAGVGECGGKPLASVELAFEVLKKILEQDLVVATESGGNFATPHIDV